MLRDYQQRAIDELYQWFAYNDGNPCMVLPTGAGKSHIVAALCRDAVQSWPETRILMLTHQKELIEQNAEKLRQHWPGAPMGICSASIGRRQLDEPITFAGIQSVRKRSEDIGYIDLVIIDECHLVSHKNEGSYRKLIDELTAINNQIRVIGLTATPYRMGHGLITDKPALFDALLEPVTVEELIHKGHLSRLRSKITDLKLDTSGVHKRGGDYIESELQAAVDNDANNTEAVETVIKLAGDRKSWLFFCSGVEHAQHVASILSAYGIKSACITGKTPKKERAQLLDEFKEGNITALTNANVLTTGFDAPGIDLIAMLRPTMSPGLYVQMAGRGLRVAPDKTDCLVLDFAGVVEAHGPITAVRTPNKKSDREKGDAPIKVCDECGEIVHPSVKICPECGHEFPPPETQEMKLRNDDIMGYSGDEMAVTSWKWAQHVSKTNGKIMLKVTYYGELSDKPVTEYLVVLHEGYAGQKARRLMADIAMSAGYDIDYSSVDLIDIANGFNGSRPPIAIEYRKDGKFYRVLNRRWHEI